MMPASLVVGAAQFRASRSLDENVQGIINHVELAAERGVQLVAFAEAAVTGYFPDEIEATEGAALLRAEAKIAAACRRCSVAAVVGTPYVAPDGRRLNRYIVASPLSTARSLAVSLSVAPCSLARTYAGSVTAASVRLSQRDCHRRPR